MPISQVLAAGTLTGAILLQAWAFLVVPTDNNGDPNDYLAIATTISPATPIPSSVNYLRSIGYPIFLKLASANVTSLNSVFLVQSVLFVLALLFVAHSPGFANWQRVLVYAPAVLPSVAYAQKLLFPDGLLLSLSLFYLGFLLRRRYYLCAVVALVQFSIKSVFILSLAVAAILLIEVHFKTLQRKILLALFAIALGAMLPATWFINSNILYTNLVWRPVHNHDIASSEIIPEDLQITAKCSNFEGLLPQATYSDRLTVEANDIKFPLPFGAPLLDNLGCSRAQALDLQRQLMWQIFMFNPTLHLQLFANHFLAALHGDYYFGHLSYMLWIKWTLYAANPSVAALYEPHQPDYFRNFGLDPPTLPGLEMLSLAKSFDAWYRRVGDAELVVFGLLVLTLLWTRRFGCWIAQPSVFGISAMVIGYAWALDVGVYTLSDRYVFLVGFYLAALSATALSMLLEASPTRQSIPLD